MKKISKITALTIAGLTLLSACAKPKEKDTTSNEKETEVKDVYVIENEGTPVENGNLRIAFISDSPFKGVFHQAFVKDNQDSEIMDYSTNGTFLNDADYKMTDGGGANVAFVPEEKKAIVTIHPKYTWNDGTPVTSKDFLIHYKIIADKDYDGARFNSKMRNIVGIEEYHDGKANEIEGFKIIDDKKFELIFKEFSSANLWGSGIAFEPIPAHIYENIPIKEQEAHDATRKNPLSPGPYYIKEIVPGQQVVLEANQHYYRGVPKIKTVIWKVVPSSQIVAALGAGEYDLTVGLDSELYSKVKEMKNVKVAVHEGSSYSYFGFKLGKWDPEKKEVITDPNAKMADVKLRQAMGYAVDNDMVAKKFYNGLSRRATQLILPRFKSYFDTEEKGYYYDEEKAKGLLDEAGYKDVNGDGIREDKEGKPLVINFAGMSGGQLDESISQYYLQQWKKIGLNVVLTTGRLIEFNSFYDKIQADDPEIDIFEASWSPGTNPNPSGLYGRKAQFNFPRYASNELDAILDKMNSFKSIDEDYRKQAYKEFTKYMFEMAPVIPTLNGKVIVAVNNRVKKYDFTPGTSFNLSDVEVTAQDPIK